MQKNIILTALLLAFSSFIQPSAFTAVSTTDTSATTKPAYTGTPSKTSPIKALDVRVDDHTEFFPPVFPGFSPESSKTDTGISPALAIAVAAYANVATQFDFQAEQAAAIAQRNHYLALITALESEQAVCRQEINEEFHDGLWAILRSKKQEYPQVRAQENIRETSEKAASGTPAVARRLLGGLVVNKRHQN